MEVKLYDMLPAYFTYSVYLYIYTLKAAVAGKI